MNISSFLLSLLWLGISQAASLVSEHFIESFSHDGPDNGVCNCTGDVLPGPINALTWHNLQNAYFFSRFTNSSMPDVVPYDGIYYAIWLNSSYPARISSRYRGSCVDAWSLDAFAFGCAAQQRFELEGTTYEFIIPSNCTVTVEGVDGRGRCVGREVFEYVPELFDTGLSGVGIKFGRMTMFNTTASGMRKRRMTELRISAKVKPSPGYTYLGRLGLGIDTVHYTTYNRTGCRSGL